MTKEKATTIKKEPKVVHPDIPQSKKLKVVTAYQESGYDIEETIRLTGCTKAQIELWHSELGKESIKGRNDIEVATSEVVKLTSKMEVAVNAKCYEVIDILLDRIKEIAPTSKDPVGIAKLLDATVKALKVKDEDKKPLNFKGTLNYVSQQYNNLGLKGNGNN